jgi:hypothetical protein
MMRGMSAPDLRQRLHALTAAIGVPTPPRGVDAEAGEGDTRLQRLAAVQDDELLQRVAALTTVLTDGDGRDWDEVDQVAAQLLLADLAAVAATTRVQNVLTAGRLANARADLGAAQADVDRTLKNTTGS